MERRTASRSPTDVPPNLKTEMPDALEAVAMSIERRPLRIVRNLGRGHFGLRLHECGDTPADSAYMQRYGCIRMRTERGLMSYVAPSSTRSEPRAEKLFSVSIHADVSDTSNHAPFRPAGGSVMVSRDEPEL